MTSDENQNIDKSELEIKMRREIQSLNSNYGFNNSQLWEGEITF